MALPTNHRWVSVGKINVRNHIHAPDDAPTFAYADLLSEMLAVEDQQAGVRVYQNDERRMWCRPIDVGQDYCSLLVQVGDKAVADPAFVDFSTFATRDAGKQDNEGGHYCGHLLISSNPDGQGRHLILLEKVPGISFTTLKAHFNWLLNRPAAAKNHVTDGVPRSYRGVAEIDGLQSTTLLQAMTAGTVVDVTFVGSQTLDQGVDEAPLVREQERQMRWAVGRPVNGDSAQSLLKQGFDWLRCWKDVEEDSKQFLIRIKSRDGQTKTAAVSATAAEATEAAQEALEGALCLNEFINDFDEPLTQRYDGLREDVLTKLRERAAVVEGR